MKTHNYRPCHVQSHQKIRQAYYAVILEFCQWTLNNANEHDGMKGVRGNPIIGPFLF